VNRYCLFCGHETGDDPAFAAAAAEFATLLARRGIGVVTGGGGTGLMGVVADAVLTAGGDVIGVIPRALVDRELAHDGIADMRVVESMHERKRLMHDLSSGFVALPGGVGTLEELVESMTWAQLGIHVKPMGVLNVAGYYDPLFELLDGFVGASFVRREHRDLLLSDASPTALVDRMQAWTPPPVKRWIGVDEA
jgi:uncharacterized protein (TIGR00730 family)